MSDNELDWDDIDFDVRVNKEQEERIKLEEKVKKSAEAATGTLFMDVEFNAAKDHYTNKILSKKSKKTTGKSEAECFEDDYVQPFPYKDLQILRSYINEISQLQNLFLGTFGEFERFVESHRQNLTDEIIIELLIIDVALLELPFPAHNELLLDALAKSEDYWSEMLKFVENFFENNEENVEVLLKFDMQEFFRNIKLLLHNFLINNRFESKIEEFFNGIVDIMSRYPESEFNCTKEIVKLQAEISRNLELFKENSIYPTLEDFKISAVSEKSGKLREVKKNHLGGKYENISDYLSVHLPLLREDFIGLLRKIVKEFKGKNVSSNRVITTMSGCIFPKVEIVKKQNTSSKIVIKILSEFRADDLKNRLFFGQLLCLSSNENFDDLINVKVSGHEKNDEIAVKIINTENISEIFDRHLVMVEPSNSFFEPYYRTFEVLKNLNEFSFPMKNQILELDKTEKFPNYQHEKSYRYQQFDFNVEDSKNWPTAHQLKLEETQLKAIKSAITTEFSLIQGPPGTGKTFIGLEILKILLENTKERIFVLTQTNNSLDKFLIGANKIIDKNIARLGKQSRCKEVERFKPTYKTIPEIRKYQAKLENYQKSEMNKSSDGNNEIFKKICFTAELKDETRQLNTFCNLNHNLLFGMTTSFATKNTALNQMLKPGIIIIEEASELLESHVIASMTRYTKQIILIGDHRQLRPMTSTYEMARDYSFNVSLFERLILNDFPYISLDVQRRMRPEISQLLKFSIYRNLRDSNEVANFPNVQGMSENLFWLNHAEPENAQGSSKINEFEVEKVYELSEHLLDFYSADDITILTPYKEQGYLIQQKVNQKVRVAILDNFQGEESKIIILSLVRSNQTNNIGFLYTENRIAVILSRAQIGLFIVGNMTCYEHGKTAWKEICQHLKSKKLVGNEFPIDSSLKK